MTITDKQIHRVVECIANDCPHCGSQLRILTNYSMLSASDREVLLRLSREGMFRIASAEETIELTKRNRDRGVVNEPAWEQMERELGLRPTTKEPTQ